MYNVLADQLPDLSIFLIFIFHTKVFGNTLRPAEAFVALTVFGRLQSALQFVPGFIQDLLGTIVALDRLVVFLNRPEAVQILPDGYTDDIVPESDETIVFDQATFSWPRGESDKPDPKAFRLTDISVKVPRGEMTLVWGALGSGKSLFVSASVLSHPVLIAASRFAWRGRT